MQPAATVRTTVADVSAGNLKAILLQIVEPPCGPFCFFSHARFDRAWRLTPGEIWASRDMRIMHRDNTILIMKGSRLL